MEWASLQHLDLQLVGRAPQQPHCAAFHPTQALLVVAAGRDIVEFDALTGCKLANIDVGAPVLRMAYSPAGGHVVLAVLEDLTIKGWDLETDHVSVLFSPVDRRSGGPNTEVHIALTPLRPWLFFGVHRRMSVNVVGTVEGVKQGARIKADVKKPITQLACHPRNPVLYVAYAEGLIKGYNIHTFSVVYSLLDLSVTRLVGAAAFAFHSSLEWIFVGDRSGTLLAWDVSVPARPLLIGTTQAPLGTPVSSLAWHSMYSLLVALSKDGSVQVYRPRVLSNPNRSHLRANFFESAGMEPLELTKLLAHKGAVYPVPRIVDLALHPKLNLATVLFTNVAAGGDDSKRRSPVSREARRQLFAVLQSARGAPATVLKEKLAVLGSVTNIMADQQQQGKGSQLTNSDFARKAFLYGNLADGHVRGGPVLTVPLLTITDESHLLRDIPVSQPVDLGLRFFNSEAGIFEYPVRAFFMDGCNLMGYNLSSGEYNTYKKLSPYAAAGTERTPKYMFYSAKQHLFLVCFECRGAPSEVVIYRDPVAAQMVGERINTVAGRDAAFLGPKDRQYAVLDDNGEELIVQFLEEDLSTVAEVVQPVADSDGVVSLRLAPNAALGADVQKLSGGSDGPHLPAGVESNGSAQIGSYGVEGKEALDPLTFSEQNPEGGVHPAGVKLPVGSRGVSGTFFFDSPVERIFSTPLESLLAYSKAGSHIGLARILADASYVADGQMLPTKVEEGRSVKLKPLETVLQLRWQETPTGLVAGVMTTQRVMILSSNLDIISSSSTAFDKCFPPFKSLVWLGPALFFSTATAVCVLGWDGVARSIVSVGTPNYSLVGALNDRLLLACANEPNPRQKQGVDIKTRLVGLLEPLLIGWTTYQQTWDPKLDLSETIYQLTSRFDSTRITPHSLDALSIGSPVCADLAVQLAQAGPQFSQELRCNYAAQAHRFAMAISILKDEYVRSRDYPRCPPTTRLFHRFRELAQACIRYGQFDRAKETFEVISDFESMFNLFLCHSNPSAMRRLAQKLEEVGTDTELKRQVEKVLLVWSSGWAQGGVFANLAADSMLPKGSEWAGGNWEIKNHPPVKSMPEWELSNEVTAYMKTANGGIPTLIPDHIGVYLGTLRGRGTVVEVRDNMLVKRLGQTSQEDTGGSGRSASSVSRNSDDGSQSGAKHKSGDEAEGDEQTRAAEAFKRGMFAVDNSSSDEEDGSKTKKRFSIQIRDKSAAVTTFDANKVKEATQTFKLSAGLPKPQRRTETPPDLFPGLASPVPVSGQVPPLAPAPTFRPQVPMGVGAGSGPIPEDFFEGTIPAGAVPPPTGGPLYQPPPGPPSGTFQAFPSAQPSFTATYPGAPQAVASGAPAIFGSAEPFQAAPNPPQNLELSGGIVPPTSQGFPMDFGLPDGGIPPESVVTTGGTLSVDLVSVEGKGTVGSVTNLGSLDSIVSQTKKPPMPTTTKPSPIVTRYKPGQVPRGAPASQCFKVGVAHIEQNQLVDAMSCLDEAFLALAKDQSLGVNVKAQARICAQYKIAVLLLQEIARLQKVEQGNVGAKEEMARLSRHLSSLPLQAKHRITCLRTAIKRNMDVQNFAFAKKLLDLLLSKAPANKQDELKVLIQLCVQRGLTDRTIDETEDASQFCAATLARLPTIGYDSCDVCGSKFSALNSAGCSICGMGTVERSDAVTGAVSSPFM